VDEAEPVWQERPRMASRTVPVDLVRRLLRTGATPQVARVVDGLAAGELGVLYAGLEEHDRRHLIEAVLASEDVGGSLAKLPEEVRAAALADLHDERIGDLVARMPPDDAVQLLGQVAAERRARVLAAVAPARREEVESLLDYPEDSAARRMTTRVLAVESSTTAAAAIDAFRRHGDVEDVFYLYVVDGEWRLTGVVPIRRLVGAPPDRPIGELALRDPIAIPASADQEEAARLVAQHDLLALPVVDADGRLLGAITVDDVIDVLSEEATEDMYRMAGLSESDRILSPFKRSVGMRLPWMLLNLATAFLAAGVVGLFSATIDRIVALAAFMPVIAGMGGIGGTQALTVVIRGIALGEVEFSTAQRAIRKELAVGATVGAATGVLTALVALLFNGNPWLGLILFLAMLLNLAVGGLAGAAVPLALRRLGVDPALGSGVLVTTFTDVIGFFVFLGLATLALPWLD
jgi:magnesium transporter